jgi:2-amino-4-hydroxy-6-hydroxymethyldihydropteridine diphosphokinase
MIEAALGLGGNLGDPVAQFATALQSLAMHPQITVAACSSVYATAPWGKTDQPEFANMAALVRTMMPAPELLSFCLLIETEAGRERGEQWGPRTLDIDILSYGEETIAVPGLTVPHPHLAERAFALVPLAEIAPLLKIGGHTIAALRDSIDITGVRHDSTASARLVRLLALDTVG